MKSNSQKKKELVDTFAEIKDNVENPPISPRPVANQIAAAYRRGAKKVEALTGRKTKLPDYAIGELDFPPAQEVVE